MVDAVEYSNFQCHIWALWYWIINVTLAWAEWCLGFLFWEYLMALSLLWFLSIKFSYLHDLYSYFYDVAYFLFSITPDSGFLDFWMILLTHSQHIGPHMTQHSNTVMQPKSLYMGNILMFVILKTKWFSWNPNYFNKEVNLCVIYIKHAWKQLQTCSSSSCTFCWPCSSYWLD